MDLSQEQIEKAMVLESNLRETEQQHEFINQQLSELSVFYESMHQIDNAKEKEILAVIGKGVYIPAKVSSENVFVEVGQGIILPKSPSEVRDILAAQIKKLQETQIYLKRQLEFYLDSLNALLQEIEKHRAL